jgi:acetate kinase
MGVRMDAARNAGVPGDAAHAIHAEGSAVEVWVVPTDEGRVAAREAARLLHPADDAGLAATGT